MDIIFSASARFDAQHVIPAYDPCSRPHGHSWQVRVSLTGDLEPKSGTIRGADELSAKVRAVAEELHEGDLAEMAPGIVTSPIGLASYFLDRLALQFPRITEVSIECSNGTSGAVRRTPRQL